MSGCGCDKENSCNDTNLESEKEPEAKSCTKSDQSLKNDKKSCRENDPDIKINNAVEVDTCGSNKPCSTKEKTCCDPDKNVSSENPNKDKTILISDYIIPKMDCSAEEQMVRMSLASVESVSNLVFDLPNRNLKVFHEGNSDLITSKLETLGFGAKLNSTEPYIDNKSAKHTSTYIIPKMDCSAEEQMVRMTLAPISAVKALSFDLPNRKLQVFHTDGLTEITSKLEALGFGAKLENTIEAIGALPDTPDPTKQAKVLKILLAINAVLFLIEFISGIIAASTGLIADSLDMFADAAVYGIALYAVGKAAKYQVKAAHFAGWIQLLLAIIVIVDIIRRFVLGSEPESNLMIIIGFLALIANVTCLYLISGHKDGGAHMKASWIFSANDVIVNMGVILAGVLVAWTGSAYPDLVIGIIVSLFVLNGARKILALK
ncbi:MULTISPECIES: cation diffusion facilitator family transporter [Gammaproteobacteria]|uniref:cation diffusion facilitator family transporter n=2 Tax=Moraxellaceae TaxID=468 RepID=UPI0032B4988B